MPTRIVTNAEIKAMLKLGSADDMIVDIWNDTATEILCSILGVSDLATHSVVDERVEVDCGSSNKLIFAEFPVNTDAITLKNTFDGGLITGYTFRKDPLAIRTVRTYNEAGTIPYSISYGELFASYTAGYRIKDALEVLSITDLVGRTISVKILGAATDYEFVSGAPTGNQIVVGVSLATTATNIANKLAGTSDGAVVTLPLGTGVDFSTTNASATPAQFSIIKADIPFVLKNAVAMIAGGGMAEKDKVSGIASYTIGGKSVSFRTDSEGSAVAAVLNSWLGMYRKINIKGI